jgi:hypothetical protein
MRDWLIGGGFVLAWVIVMAVLASHDRRLKELEARWKG